MFNKNERYGENIMEYSNERIDEIKQAQSVLTKAKKENNRRMFERYLAIYLYLKREITLNYS